MIKIQTKTGNLMNVTEGHIVHGCNAQGVMGSGVALAVKRKFPGAYEDYARIYFESGLVVGRAYPSPVAEKLIVWNAITQDQYGNGRRLVSYDAIETCFNQVNEHVSRHASLLPAQIHIPLIGAARAGGNWEIIREIIEQTMDHPVTLWLPDDTVDTK